jgi:hypothetical protein
VTAAHLLSCALLVVLAGTPASGLAGEPPREPLDLSDIRIEAPSLRHPITGRYRYTSPLDGTARELRIRENPDGFWRYEGVALSGTDDVVLKLEQSDTVDGYEGRLARGFDALLGESAYVESAHTYADALTLNVIVVPDELPPAPRCPRCAEAVSFGVVAAGAGREVRLKPASEVSAVRDDRTPVQAPHPDEEVRRRDDDPHDESWGAGYQVGAPSLPDGARVTLLGRRNDPIGRTWLKVRALAPPEDGAEPATGWVRAAQVVGRLRYELERVPSR